MSDVGQNQTLKEHSGRVSIGALMESFFSFSSVFAVSPTSPWEQRHFFQNTCKSEVILHFSLNFGTFTFILVLEPN